MSTVSIAGLNKADVLAALYNAARPVGLGIFARKSEPMTREQAQELLDTGVPSLYFDYVHGRPLKIDLADDELNTRLYNRDQGDGAAERVITELRERGVA